MYFSFSSAFTQPQNIGIITLDTCHPGLWKPSSCKTTKLIIAQSKEVLEDSTTFEFTLEEQIMKQIKYGSELDKSELINRNKV